MAGAAAGGAQMDTEAHGLAAGAPSAGSATPGASTVAAPACAGEERLTEDLLKRLLASSSPEAYLDEGLTVNRSLAEYLGSLLVARSMKRADVVRASGINGTVVYDIFKGKSRPGRDHAIMLAFGLSCDLLETRRLLKLAGVSELYPKTRRDAIVIWCISRGMTRAECDDELWRFGERTLLGTGSLR